MGCGAVGLVSQGLTILDSVRQNLSCQGSSDASPPPESGGNGLLQLHSCKDGKTDDGPVAAG